MISEAIFYLVLWQFVAGLILLCFAGYGCLKARFRLAGKLATAGSILLGLAFIFLAWLIARETTDVRAFVEMLTNCVILLGILAGGAYVLYRLQFQKNIQRLTATSSIIRLGNTNFARLEATICNQADSRIFLRDCKYLVQFFEEREGRLVQVYEEYGDFSGNVRMETEGNPVMARSVDARSTTRFGVTFGIPPQETIVEVLLTVAPELTLEAYAFEDVHLLPGK